jgi:competence protein ComEC
LTLFGCAKSEHLAYDEWNRRNLTHITNNQAGNILLNGTNEWIEVYVENLSYASKLEGLDSFKKLYECVFIGVV